MPKVFSGRTLGRFEDASASIPLRQLDRVFSGAGIRLGEDPGGPEGARRTQFRRYVAGVDQDDPQQLDRLGDVLGGLIEEVADSKKDFLVKAAEHDGFVFTDGAFRPAGASANSFVVKRIEDAAFIDDCSRRLGIYANDDPNVAIAGSKELVESVCRIVLERMGRPAPRNVAVLTDIATSTLSALEAFDRASPQQLVAVVVSLGAPENTPRHARLAVGAAITFVRFVAETYVERAAPEAVAVADKAKKKRANRTR